MEAGETMVEILRSTQTSNTPISQISTASTDTHEGIKQYYIQKIEELQVKLSNESREEFE